MTDAATKTPTVAQITFEAIRAAGSIRALAARLSQYTPVTYGSVGHWVKGTHNPDAAKMQVIALTAPIGSPEYEYAAAVLAAMKAE
jgi:hypothetical protein